MTVYDLTVICSRCRTTVKATIAAPGPDAAVGRFCGDLQLQGWTFADREWRPPTPEVRVEFDGDDLCPPCSEQAGR